ncbi:kinase-like domain-containing protein [Sphaerosporella brunnea]|uniref:Kinase-like domain-containing protein n=1 Tax=Sphaerosporella brunnea TaxID=1250544 RepID=A0A5J5EUM8_9PEZI|nr:kinase-like domain-containing protein [Sphaerosporella brunnea]
MGGTVTVDKLRRQIEKLRIRSTNDRYFVSPRDLKNLFTREVIAEVLVECAVEEYQRPKITSRIFTEGRVVLAILIWKKWQHKLMSFVEHNALDNELPLDVERAKKIAETFGWDFAKNVQWEFLPRALEKEMSGYHCYFREEEILPFIDEVWLGEGGFGEVWKMSVLPSLQTFFPETASEIFVVRKKLRAGAKSGGRYLQREMECLRILDHLRHPNIIQLLGSYTYRDSHYFLFPLFQLDLEHFLKLDDRFGHFDKDFTFFTALQGLSSAIEKVHSLNLRTSDHDIELERIGYHHDIRPANVLVDSNSFFLADFGLARMKPGDKDSKTKWKSGLGDYVAPECIDEKLLHREVGRPLDIWSFGCMLSEIAVYMAGGPGAVKDFREQRHGPGFRANMTNQYFFHGGRLRPSVTGRFEDIQRSDNPTLRRLLEVTKSMLSISPKDRPTAAQVHQQLSSLSIDALFHAVQQAFTRYLEVTAQKDVQASTAATVKLQSARFAAWGKILELTGGGASADITAVLGDNGSLFRRTLLKLFGKLDLDAGNDQAPSSVVAFSIQKPIHDELQELIECLENALPTRHREKLRQVWLQDSLASSNETLHGIGSSLQSHQYSELGVLASTKLETRRLEGDETEVSEFNNPESASLLLSSDGLHIQKRFDEGLSIAQYHDKQVFVEWVSRTAKWNEMAHPARLQRMQLMAEVFHRSSKPSSFRVLKCIGFVAPTASSRSDYGFVYSFPEPTLRQRSIEGIQGNPKGLAPISLFEILNQRNKVDLPLGEKFRLAHKLVSCVGELHIVQWLHKNINSRNIIFFEEKGRVTSLSDALENPYLINFRYSRHSENASHSEKPVGTNRALPLYHHPDYTSGEHRFQETFDYYSIGILLLELGGWATMEQYLDHNPQLESNPSAFRDILIKKYVPRLKHLMGVTYTNVTLACLKSDFGMETMGCSAGVDGHTVLGKFYDKVVVPLGELSRYPI